MPTYTTIEEQVEFGLETVDAERRVMVSLRDLLFVSQTMAELNRFFHNPMHYPSVREVERFLGNKDAGAYSLIKECYYRKMPEMLPADINDRIEDFDNPSPPYYYAESDFEDNLSKVQTAVPWKLPVSSTSFLYDAKFQMEAQHYCTISCFFEVGDDVATLRLVFGGCEGFRTTYMAACGSDIIKSAYDKVTDMGETSWLNEVRAACARRVPDSSLLRHLAVYFDDGPAYEFICRAFSVNDGNLTNRLPKCTVSERDYNKAAS